MMKMKRNGIIRYAGVKHKQNTTLTTVSSRKNTNLKNRNRTMSQLNAAAMQRTKQNNNTKSGGKQEKVEKT